MPPVTRWTVFKRRVRVALRPAFAAAVLGCALAPQAAPAAPLASFVFSPTTPFSSEPVEFTSTSSGATLPERWDLDGDRLCDDATGPAATRSFWPPGTYAVTLCISDGTDDATVTRRFVVQNRPPAAAITYSPIAPESGDTIVLTSTSADPDGPLVAQAWDLDGDGAFDDARGPAVTGVRVALGGILLRLADDRLDRGDGERRVVGDRPGVVGDIRPDLLVGHDPVDEAHLVRLRGREQPRGEEDLLGEGRADQLDQAVHAGKAVAQAEPRRRDAEARALAADPQIAAGRERDAAADAAGRSGVIVWKP